jgi:hypothetical protein
VFDGDHLSILEEQESYALKSGKETVRTFADKAALSAISKYGFTNLCVVGKDKLSLKYMRR